MPEYVNGSPITAPDGTLLAALNLSDVASLTQARINLGLSPESGESDWIRYVDSVNGNDGNVGSVGAPWKTLVYARSRCPAINRAKAEIHLVGAGPYTESQYTAGPVPVGDSAEPLYVIGDEYTQVATGSVTSVAAPTVTTNLVVAADTYRGYYIRVLTGTGAGQVNQIATHDGAGVFTDVANGTFGMAAGSTFEVVKCTTAINLPANSRPGFMKAVYWRCKLVGAGVRFAGNFTEIGYDACELNLASSMIARDFALVWAFPTPSMGQWMRKVTDKGTQSGQPGLFLSGAASAIQALFDGGIQGYVVGQSGLLAQRNGKIQLAGYDCLASAPNVQVDTEALVLLTGYGRIKATTSGIGVIVRNAGVINLTGTKIEGMSTAAVTIDRGGYAELTNVSGSTGNTGVGVLINPGGQLGAASGNSVTGTNGDVQLGNSAKVSTWAQVNTQSAVRNSAKDFPTFSARKTFAAHAAVTATDPEYIPLDSAGGAFAQNLPAANAVPAGWRREFKDETQSCLLNPVTLTAVGADVFEGGAGVFAINVNGASVTVQSDGVGVWYIVSRGLV